MAKDITLLEEISDLDLDQVNGSGHGGGYRRVLFNNLPSGVGTTPPGKGVRWQRLQRLRRVRSGPSRRSWSR